MPEVFTVSAGDASTMQRHYEQMIETLLRALLDAKQDKNNEYQGLKIFDKDRLVYGRDQNQFRDAYWLEKKREASIDKIDWPIDKSRGIKPPSFSEIRLGDEVSGLSGQLLNPQLIVQLQRLRSTPVGGIVEGAANKTVELDGRIVLQSDENGRVTVNTLESQNTIQNTNPQPVNQVQEKEVQKNNNSSTINGSERVMSSLQSIEDSPLKALLLSTLQQLQNERKALEQERALYRNLIERRLQQPQNRSWWQQVKNNVLIVIGSVDAAFKMAVQEFREHSAKHKGAASLKALFHSQTRPGEREYQTPAYQIFYNGSSYEVLDLNSNRKIMQFRSTPLGVKIEKENLNPTHIKDIDDLRHSLEQNEPIPTSFNSVGKQEAEYLNRVNNVVNALIQYALARQEDVEIDGALSYKWKASQDGSVSIVAKDGRGTLLQKEKGSITSSMNEKDLAHFEQVFSHYRFDYSVTFSPTKVESQELER
ncbi:hypothetical protein ACE1AT_21900 [Pelatocladus sp. BLCC-F211]|uniref:hypothetical protein n=1 Tax=Pelatocladus sp. BLCC-F211 TaxID=3342752 RepID=UPI0035BB693C